MNIEIKIENNQITLLLSKNGQVIDSVDFPEERQLSEKLLLSIDKLLKKNRLEAQDVPKIIVQSDLGDNFTTFRIAKSVADAWNYAQQEK